MGFPGGVPGGGPAGLWDAAGRPRSARRALGRAPGRASQGRARGADAGPAAPRAGQARAGTEQIEPGKSCRPKISRWGDPLCTDRWSGLRSASGSGGANRKNHVMSAHQVLRKAQPRVVAGGQPVISCTAPKPITGLLALPHQCGDVVGERGSAHRPAPRPPGVADRMRPAASRLLPGVSGREREGGEAGGFGGGDAEQAQHGLGELVDRGLVDACDTRSSDPANRGKTEPDDMSAFLATGGKSSPIRIRRYGCF